jgi:hypothetical protein
LGNSLYGVRANILDVPARPFKQKTRMDTMPLPLVLEGRLPQAVDGMQQHV